MQDRMVVGVREISYREGDVVKTLDIPQEWQGKLTESGGKIDIPDLSPELGNSFIEIAGSPPKFVLRKEGKPGYHSLSALSESDIKPLDQAGKFMKSDTRFQVVLFVAQDFGYQFVQHLKTLSKLDMLVVSFDDAYDSYYGYRSTLNLCKESGVPCINYSKDKLACNFLVFHL